MQQTLKHIEKFLSKPVSVPQSSTSSRNDMSFYGSPTYICSSSSNTSSSNTSSEKKESKQDSGASAYLLAVAGATALLGTGAYFVTHDSLDYYDRKKLLKEIDASLDELKSYRHIISNKIECKECHQQIESTSRLDFKRCKCNAVAVDGGFDYLYRFGTQFIELSQVENPPEVSLLEETRKFIVEAQQYSKLNIMAKSNIIGCSTVILMGGLFVDGFFTSFTGVLCGLGVVLGAVSLGVNWSIKTKTAEECERRRLELLDVLKSLSK